MFTPNLTTYLAQTQSKSGQAAAEFSPLTMNARVKTMSHGQIEQTAKDFESMFITQMLEPMFGESLGTDLFGDEQSSDIYKGMMMEQFGKEITRSGGIGIADYVKRELLRLQEV